MNGIIVINKDLGYTSRDVVNLLCKKLNTGKIGHTGTLDPNASGVMVLCIGKGLKVCELLSNHDKEYIAGVTLGIETDTLDMDNNATILKDISVNICEDRIREAVSSFKGRYMQKVPMYSAVKVSGRKLYEYARSNTFVDVPSKAVDIKNIQIIDDIVYNNGKINFKIKCTVSKGTYIRSLIRDIGDKLGVPAVMSSLVRTKVGNFDITNSYTLDDIMNDDYKIIGVIDAIQLPRIKVDDDIAFKVKNGVMLDKFFDGDKAMILDKDDNLIAIYENVLDKSRVYKMF